ncbi:RNA-binding protein [Runella rosea]|uniref:RNA-binding protein n=1 Tax=Runella rosea TaxID=2259595 RepID=A0A344TQW1_9BACT|nr:VCBS repeat-containing protein [Runella rosea]AXE21032.1 RNA-binding protein [Runella rosea]
MNRLLYSALGFSALLLFQILLPTAPKEKFVTIGKKDKQHPSISAAAQPLFKLLSPDQTGVRFINQIKEDDSLHIFKYEYLYNGNGVGVGDFDNDGLPDLFFSGNTVPHKLYLNRKNWKFEDVTAPAGITGNGTWGTGVSVVDINGDGLLDIYVCHSGKFPSERLVNELFINQGVQKGIPVFKESAREYGLDLPGTQSTQAAFFDYDRDGDLDVFVLNHSNHTYNPFLNTRSIRATPDMRFGNRLLKNEKGLFEDVTLQAGIINNPLNFGLGVAIADLNHDGWPDIYSTSDYTEQDCLYLNQQDGTFKESLRQSMAHTSKFSMGVDIADYNNDTRPDVFTLDMLPEDNHRQKMLKGPDEYDQYKLLIDSGYYHQNMRNMLQLNQGVKQNNATPAFSEIGQLAGVSATDWSWAGLFADFDNDGWQDLFVSNGYLRDFTDLDFMKYTVAEAKLDYAARGILDFQTFELVKKMPSNRLLNYVFRNNHDLTFSKKNQEWGITSPSVSTAAAYADFDDDGDMDMVVCNQNEPVHLYQNQVNLNSDKPHFLKVKLKGQDGNAQALGAKVIVETTAGVQYRELYPVRGYQASVEPLLSFGLGTQPSVKSLTVYWPNGKRSILPSPPTDRLIELSQQDATETAAFAMPNRSPIFTETAAKNTLYFHHRENDFIDFKVEVLIPYQLSRLGPALAKADVNSDGLEDIFAGGAVEQSGELWMQRTDGNFQRAAQQPWQKEAVSEDVNALFFDADGDKDADLYVVSGGNEYESGSPEYQDRLYINDGKGLFQRAISTLPTMNDSKMAVTAADFDQDGDLDLFVGGRGKAGFFPMPSVSYLLRNDKGIFTDITDQTAPALRTIGMVQTAVWADLDKDKYPELILAGDWMPLKIFRNKGGRLTDISEESGLTNTEGLWATLLPADVDNDGDLDIIAGNAGLNNQFRASVKEPMSIVAADINDDGVIDPIWCYFIEGKSYPVASRDELLDQVVPLRKKFNRYHLYANATINDIYTNKQLAQAHTVYCRQLASGIFRNNNGKFDFEAFSVEAQFSRISSILYEDVDQDGHKDLLLLGNFHPYRVQMGPCDGSFGQLMKGNGKGLFTPLSPAQTGLWAQGDVRTATIIQTKSGPRKLLLGLNNDQLKIFEFK